MDINLKILYEDREFYIALSNLLHNKEAVLEMVETLKKVNKHLELKDSLEWMGNKTQFVSFVTLMKSSGLICGPDKRFIEIFKPAYDVDNYYSLKSKLIHDDTGTYNDSPIIEEIIKSLKNLESKWKGKVGQLSIV